MPLPDSNVAEPEATTHVFNTQVGNVDPAQLEASVTTIVKETKAGYKTTEFWITVVAALAVVFDGIPAPESKEGYIAAGLAAVYAVARGFAKKGIPHVVTEPK